MSEIGNQNGIVLKDPMVRQEAYRDFCAHLSKGKSIKSWWYDDNKGNMCVWSTMLSYIKNNPSEFDPIKKEISEIKGFNHWESVVEASAEGSNKRANTASLQMVMRNKYGWDKEQEGAQVPPNDLQIIVAHENMALKAKVAELEGKIANISQAG